jgi:hypothetical protein
LVSCCSASIVTRLPRLWVTNTKSSPGMRLPKPGMAAPQATPSVFSGRSLQLAETIQHIACLAEARIGARLAPA